ncbi:hypothetical protein HYALB_00007625 [Hymenoscyphus albidus]|uniref:F-box domain-containing protein n=1 Tax=Hymenoscyphus albidus TaxID=595503 RepID=A0A9N9LJ44_9HELO|nr:hypothetical protein HYALB_00007625 [Hymenoscyphus albidus]
MFYPLRAWYHNRYRPLALSTSPLSIFPSDILHEILSHLPTSSAVAFSISCMHFKRLLGNTYIPKLSKSPTEKISLLHLLEKELANHIVCEVCKKLHNLKDAAHFLLTHGRSPLETPLCIWDETLNEFHSSHIRYRPGLIFSTTLIKMARKPHLLDNTHKDGSEAIRARCSVSPDPGSHELRPRSVFTFWYSAAGEGEILFLGPGCRWAFHHVFCVGVDS